MRITFRERLKALGLTQAELAEKMGVSRETISRQKDGLAYVDAYLTEREARQELQAQMRALLDRWA